MPISIPTAAILGAAGIGAAGTVASGFIGASAAKSAAATQAAAGQQAATIAQQAGTTANTELANTLGQQQTLLAPYVNEGTAGLNALNAAVAPGGSLTSQFSFDPTQIANNPNYQFLLSEGIKAVQRGAAATGTLASGGTLKALDQYSQGLGTNELAQAYQQALSTYQTNRNTNLQNISLPLQTGQYGTSDLLNALQNYGNLFSQNTLGTAQIVGSDLTGAANAKAAGTVGAANAYGGALGGLANSAQTFALLSALTAPNAQPSTQIPTGAGIGNPANYQIPSVAAPATPTYAPAPTAFPSYFPGAPGLSGYIANYYGAPPTGGG